MNSSFKVVVSLMSFWGVAWLTLRMLGESSTRCHLEIWSLGMPWYWGHVKYSQGQEALELFQQMQQEGVQPNSVTVVEVLNACASVLALEEGRSVHEQISRSGCECDVFVGNGLVDMYAKCGSLEDAWGVFNKMASQNVITWNAIVGGCAMDAHGKEPLRHFE
jgi:pentatricopeptide repeat protein